MAHRKCGRIVFNLGVQPLRSRCNVSIYVPSQQPSRAGPNLTPVSRNAGQSASVRRPRDSWNRVVEQIATRLLRFATVRTSTYAAGEVHGVCSRKLGTRMPDTALRTLSETPGKDQKVAEPDRAVAIQVEPRVIPRVALAEAEFRRELHEVGEADGPVTVEVSSKG